jgi:hypothetical protein
MVIVLRTFTLGTAASNVSIPCFVLGENNSSFLFVRVSWSGRTLLFVSRFHVDARIQINDSTPLYSPQSDIWKPVSCSVKNVREMFSLQKPLLYSRGSCQEIENLTTQKISLLSARWSSTKRKRSHFIETLRADRPPFDKLL